jgi:hypothetical protein
VNLKPFALIALCAPFLGPQGPVKITSVEPTMAYEPDGVAIRGTNLDLIQKARINGLLVPLLHDTGTMIVLAPEPQDPGFGKLELFHSQGSVQSEIEFMPSIQASLSADKLRVTLHGGEPGPYWLHYSSDLLSAPLVRPWIYYRGMLDLTTRASGLLAKGISDGSPITLSFLIPPWMAPAHPIHIQGMCLYPTPVESEWSYTNAFTVP